jgi:ABC-type transporter Mla MlaB component
VAIFGLFGKKDIQPATPAEKNPARTKRDEGSSRPDAKISPAERSKQVQRNAARANATARKIDAIESEMSSEFIPTHAANTTIPAPSTIAPSAVAPQASQIKTVNAAQSAPELLEPALPPMEMSTDFLLGKEEKSNGFESISAEDAQAIEEAAILFANEQTELVEQMLQSTIHEPGSKHGSRTAWLMLFDLYQITGKQQQFENLSIEYASKFETSPPAWIAPAISSALQAPASSKGVTPTVPFSGKLDGNIVKLLERAQKLGETTKILRLDFARVTAVDPVGCGLLLRILQKLQATGHDLILVSAPELADKIRAIVQVGRRDETEAPWLLLLEILRLLNQEKEFEEASIDYCITFEVSPPAFVAPKNKVTTAAEEESGSVNTISDCFTMPTVIEGKIDQLVSAISTFASEHNPAVLDCSRLNRVDFTSAGELTSHLAPLCGEGKAIEFHNVNHLVYVLFGVMGLKEFVSVFPRKV